MKSVELSQGGIGKDSEHWQWHLKHLHRQSTQRMFLLYREDNASESREKERDRRKP